jgi:hypothetical protein
MSLQKIHSWYMIVFSFSKETVGHVLICDYKCMLIYYLNDTLGNQNQSLELLIHSSFKMSPA